MSRKTGDLDEVPWYFLVVKTQKRARDMPFTPTIFTQLVEAIDRRRFDAIVERHDGDAYDKSFHSWDHLMALIYAQLSGLDSLRALEVGWKAHANGLYHLGCDDGCEDLPHATLSDANERRPVEVFAETFGMIVKCIDRTTRRGAEEFIRLIDSTPIPLGKLFKWAKSNGHIRGMKAHIVYDPKSDAPQVLAITAANVNDAQIGRTIALEPERTYVFDKGYCHYGWWTKIHQIGAFFVTRPKDNMGLAVTEVRALGETLGDGFTVLADEQVKLSSKGDSKLPIPMRRIRVLRHQDGKKLSLLTNDMKRSAVEIGTLYKLRWQIELLFRWLKQHLKIRKFLGRNENAIKLQIFAAMIAYVLLRLAALTHKVRIDISRMTDLTREFLFARRRIGAIQTPPPVHPSGRRDRSCPNQLAFVYA
jgi:putative transposase